MNIILKKKKNMHFIYIFLCFRNKVKLQGTTNIIYAMDFNDYFENSRLTELGNPELSLKMFKDMLLLHPDLSFRLLPILNLLRTSKGALTFPSSTLPGVQLA